MNTMFHNLEKKIKKLKIQHHTPKKDGSINAYIDIKKVVDTLFDIGSPIHTSDHVEAILDGLYEEYDGHTCSFSQ